MGRGAEAPIGARGWITFGTMGAFATAGFLLQNYLIQRYYHDEGMLHARVMEIKREELAAIAAAGAGASAASDSRAAAPRPRRC